MITLAKYSSRILFYFLLITLSIGYTQSADAVNTTLDIAVNGDGSVVLTATAVFSVCPNPTGPSYNWGYIEIVGTGGAGAPCTGPNGPFNGNGSCVSTIDRAPLNGIHTFTVEGSDCAGIFLGVSKDITFDNTPSATITNPAAGTTSEPFDLTCAVHFTPSRLTSYGNIGYIALWLNGYSIGGKGCSTTDCTFQNSVDSASHGLFYPSQYASGPYYSLKCTATNLYSLSATAQSSLTINCSGACCSHPDDLCCRNPNDICCPNCSGDGCAGNQ
jgi:hypothetical protein